MSRPTNVREFRREAVRVFHKSNPDAHDVKITWVRSAAVTFPTGYKGFTGAFTAESTGYRPRVMNASFVEGGGLLVR
jgi:hypothetical protein